MKVLPKSNPALIPILSASKSLLLKPVPPLRESYNDGTMTEEDWSKLFWVETPKDEVRNNSKEGVPRTFRVGIE